MDETTNPEVEVVADVETPVEEAPVETEVLEEETA